MEDGSLRLTVLWDHLRLEERQLIIQEVPGSEVLAVTMTTMTGRASIGPDRWEAAVDGQSH